MPLTLQLDRNKKRPLYQQITEQIKNKISQGHLPIGTRLPSVRQLAQDLELTRLTVHNAYSELQAAGWVESTVGRGTFVADTIRPTEQMANIGRHITPDGVIGDMTPISQITGLHSMAYAYPDTASMPLDDFWESLTRLRDDGAAVMQYGLPDGDPQLRVEIASLLQERKITATPDDIIITAGATQGLAMVAQVLAQPGDTVLLELPTYYGFFSVLASQRLHPIGIPRDKSGLRLDILERILAKQRPRFFFVVPNFHNPTGWSMPLAQQQELLALAEHYGLTLVEDDIYGQLSYIKPVPSPLKAADKGGSVIYLSAFSKALMPGLRIGYMVVTRPLKERLSTRRGAMDLFGPQLLQRALADFLHRKKYKRHLQRVIPVYQERRDVLLQTLAGWMPDGVSWTEPEGGFSCWLTLPADERLNDLYQAALNSGLAFSPGSVFMTEPDNHQHLRLCFSNQTTETIRESVILLSELIQERLTGRAQTIQRPLNSAPFV